MMKIYSYNCVTIREKMVESVKRRVYLKRKEKVGSFQRKVEAPGNDVKPADGEE